MIASNGRFNETEYPKQSTSIEETEKKVIMFIMVEIRCFEFINKMFLLLGASHYAISNWKKIHADNGQGRIESFDV